MVAQPLLVTSDQLAFRQLHLDFHTSEHLTGIGARFDKAEFKRMLVAGHVQLVNLFAKCHHGWSYYNTRVGRRHPNLTLDLLTAQVEACREAGISYQIYLSVGVDEAMAVEHPEWVVKDRGGRSYEPLKAGWFKYLRLNSPYLDYLCSQISELLALYPDALGLWLDIIHPKHDYSPASLSEMKAMGLNPEIEEDVELHARDVLRRYHQRVNAEILAQRPGLRIFHNAGHVPVGAQSWWGFDSHLELESLPTGGWGYDHFPLSALYAATTGRAYLGMTGKFHGTWGEFGGYKHADALLYECAAMLAWGARCSVGDQLHPSGAMNPDTYAIIGQAYAWVERREDWCRGAQLVAEVGLVSCETDQDSPRQPGGPHYQSDEGAARMLLEAQVQFMVLDRHDSWDRFRVIILPDSIVLDDDMLAKAQRHLARGGRILASGASLLNTQRDAFALSPGARLIGRGSSDPDYLIPKGKGQRVSVTSPIVIHGRCWLAEPLDATVLVDRADAAFNRTWEHFNGHQHAPDLPPSIHPAALRKGGLVWFAHDIFRRYRLYGMTLYRDLVIDALWDLLDSRPKVHTSLPSAGRVSLTYQAGRKRHVLHLLYAPASLRGASSTKHGLTGEHPLSVEVIDSLPTLAATRIRLRFERPPSSIRIVPEGSLLEVSMPEADCYQVTVPEFTGACLLEIND